MFEARSLLTLPSIEPNLYWRALSPRAVGVAVVTAGGSSGPAGFLALSVTHLTPSPPIVMVSIGSTTSALAAICESGHFAVNFLNRDQEPVADVFAGKTARKGPDRFDMQEWASGLTGAPVLRGGCGFLDCVLVETIERYATIIALGRVVDFGRDERSRPLVHYRGSYLDL